MGSVFPRTLSRDQAETLVESDQLPDSCECPRCRTNIPFSDSALIDFFMGGTDRWVCGECRREFQLTPTVEVEVDSVDSQRELTREDFEEIAEGIDFPLKFPCPECGEGELMVERWGWIGFQLGERENGWVCGECGAESVLESPQEVHN